MVVCDTVFDRSFYDRNKNALLCRNDEGECFRKSFPNTSTSRRSRRGIFARHDVTSVQQARRVANQSVVQSTDAVAFVATEVEAAVHELDKDIISASKIAAQPKATRSAYPSYRHE